MKYFIGIVIVAVVGLGGYFAWQMYEGFKTASQTEEEQVPVVTTKRYATTTFAIQYPSNFTVNEMYQYTGVPNKPVDGVQFTVPIEMAEGTNLDNDSGVSVEWLPRAQNCTGGIYVLDEVRAFEMSVGSTTYSVATTSGAGAGNVYEEHIYALPESDPCTAVRYFIHSSGIADSFSTTTGDATQIQKYDRATLLRAFDEMRNSLELVR